MVAVMQPGLLFVSFQNNFGEAPSAGYLLLLATPLGLAALVIGMKKGVK